MPTSSSHKVVSSRTFLHSDTRVTELIDTESANWKSAIVDALFVPHEAEIVKGMTLSSRLPADKLIWPEAPNGLKCQMGC